MKRVNRHSFLIFSIAVLLVAPALFAGHTQSPIQIKMGEIEGLLSKYGAPNDEKSSSQDPWEEIVASLNYNSLTNLKALPVKDIHDRMLSLRDTLKDSSMKASLSEDELKVASRFLRAQTKFYLLYMKAAHAGAGLNPVAANLSLKPIDELNLQIETSSGLRLYQGHRFNARHNDANPNLIEFFVTEEQKRDAELLSLPKPKHISKSWEKKNPSTPQDELNYARLITFSTINNLTQNRWALQKMFSPATITAPTSCAQGYFFTLKNPQTVIADLSTSDWYNDVFINQLPYYSKVSKPSLIEDAEDFTFFFIKNYMKGVEGKNLQELISNYGEDPNFQLALEDLYSAQDSFVKILIKNQKDNWEARGIDVLQTSSFEQDSFDPGKIATRMANFHHAYLMKAAIQETKAYVDAKLAAQAIDEQGAHDFVKVVNAYIEAKKPQWIFQSMDNYLKIAKTGTLKETIAALSQARISQMVGEVVNNAAMAVPAYYEKMHLEKIKPSKLVGLRYDAKSPLLKQSDFNDKVTDYSGTFKLTVSTPDLWKSFIHAKLQTLEDQGVNLGVKETADTFGNQVVAVREMRLIQTAFSKGVISEKKFPTLASLAKNPVPVFKIPGSGMSARLQQIREAIDSKQTSSKSFAQTIEKLAAQSKKQTADLVPSLILAILYNDIEHEYEATKKSITTANKNSFFAQIVLKHSQKLFQKFPSKYQLAMNDPAALQDFLPKMQSDYLTPNRFVPKLVDPILKKPIETQKKVEPKPSTKPNTNPYFVNTTAVGDNTLVANTYYKTFPEAKPSQNLEELTVEKDSDLSEHVRLIFSNLGLNEFTLPSGFTNRDLTPTLFDHLIYSNTLLSFAYASSPILKNEREVTTGYVTVEAEPGIESSLESRGLRPNVFRLLNTYNPKTSADGSLDKKALESHVRTFLNEANENDQKNLEEFCKVNIAKRDTKSFKKLFLTASAIRDALTQSESLKKVDDDITEDITPWYETSTAMWVFMGGLLVLAVLTSVVNPLSTPMLALFLSALNFTAAESMTLLSIKTQVIEPSNQFNFELRVASSYILNNPDQRIAAVEKVNADHKTLQFQTALTLVLIPLDALNFHQAANEFSKFLGTRTLNSYAKVSGNIARGFGDTIDVAKPFQTFSKLRNEKGLFTAFKETASRLMTEGIKTGHHQFITNAEKNALMTKAITDALPRDISDLAPVLAKRIEEISAQLTSEGTLLSIADKIRKSISQPISSPLFLMPKLFTKAVFNGTTLEFIQNYGSTLDKLLKIQARSVNRELGTLKQQQIILDEISTLSADKRTASEFAERMKSKNLEITTLESLLKIKDKSVSPALITDLKTAFETRNDLKELKPLITDETPPNVVVDLKNTLEQLKREARFQPETQAEIIAFEKEVDGLTP